MLIRQVKSDDRVYVPIPLDPDENLVDYFSGLLQDETGDYCGDFLGALDTDVSHHHDRATVDDIQIDSVEVDDDGNATVEYTVLFSWYVGCQNLDGADESNFTAIGTKEDDFWVFDAIPVVPQRSTLDEF